MSKWEKVKDTDYGYGYVVHEVRCSKCKTCVTYVYEELLPKVCYCCGDKIEGEKE